VDALAAVDIADGDERGHMFGQHRVADLQGCRTELANSASDTAVSVVINLSLAGWLDAPVRRVDPNEPRFGRYRRARAGSRQSAGASSIHCAPACLPADPEQDLRGVRRLPETGVPLSADRPERSDDHRQVTTALLGAVGCSPVSVAYLSSPEW